MKDNWINNYYFLHNLIRRIKERITDCTLVEVYRQNPREHVFQMAGEESHLSLTFFAYGKDNFVFTGQKEKPRHGAPLFFRDIMGYDIRDCGTFHQDRSFYLTFDEDYRLVFKMYGRHANVILFEGEEPIHLLKPQFQNDWHKKFSIYHQPDQQHFEAFQKALHEQEDLLEATKRIFPTWPRDALNHIRERGIENQPPQEQWEAIRELHEYFLGPSYYLARKNPEHKNDPGLLLSPLPPPEPIKTTEDPEEAAVHYARMFFSEFNILLYQNALLDHYRQKEKQLSKKISANEGKLEKLIESYDYKTLADIIMANLHQLEKGLEEARLYDFYNDTEVKILLKKDLSPQKNAERYYRKGRNQGYELEKLEQQIEQDRQHLQEVRQYQESLREETSLKALQKWYKKLFEPEKTGKKAPQSTSFREFEYKGYKIYLGKSAKSNDELTFGFANKNDLWLHARDRQGSHVVVRNPGVDKFPEEVIEKAASLAAYYSKGKGESLCPVTYTRKKYVWKPKGAPPGAAALKNEEVRMVEPDNSVME